MQARCLLLVLVASACGGTLVREAPFRARPDSIESGDLRGPFSGRVLDADTARPITGALVFASWRFVEGYGLEGPAGWRQHVASTDAGGGYVVPRLEDGPGGSARLADFRLVIYKRGYVAFRSDRRFEDFGPRTDFTQRGQVVELARWRPEASHVRHLRYVGGGPTLSELTSWERDEAIAELAGERRPAPVATPGEPSAPGTPPPAPVLQAEKLLLPADVVAQTGFDGTFDVGELGDEPSTASYDSVHFQARGRSETFDVAMRVWRLTPEEAQKQFERLLGELPGAIEKNELGDRSVRAATAGGEILGLAFLDSPRGSVVLLQCGASQCRSHEKVLALARLVRERLEALP